MNKILRYNWVASSSTTKHFMGSVFIFLLFVVSNNQSNAQNPQWMVFDTLNSPLPGNNVWAVILDDIDNKWFISWPWNPPNAISTFDGFNWLIYDHFNNGMIFPTLLSMVAENHNTIWIAASESIIRMKDDSFTVFQYPDIPLSQYSWIPAATIDSNGVKWFGTMDGLLSYNDSVWMLYNLSNSGIPTNKIYNVNIDANGNKWIGTDSGFVKYDDSVWVVYDLSHYLWNPGNTILSMATDPAGVKWFATYDGLFRYDDTNWTVFNKTNTPLIENDYRSIAFDNAGTLWLGTGGSGLWKYDGFSWTRYYHYNSGLPQNTVQSIAIDVNNNKWIGTRAGLAVFNETGVVLPVEYQMLEKMQAEVYPNPADQYVIIPSSTVTHVKIEQMEVFSIIGVKQNVAIITAGQREWKVATENLPNGIYLVRLLYSTGEQASAKFIVHR